MTGRGAAWIVPLLVFVAAAVTVVALVLLAQAWLRWRQHRTIVGRVRQPRVKVSERQQKELLRAGASEEEPRGLDRLIARIFRSDKLQLLLEQAAVEWRPSRFVLLTALGAVVFGLVGFLVTRVAVLALLPALVGGVLPYLYLLRKKKQRLESFEQSFPEAIDLLARAIRAGHAFSTGLQMVGEEMADPLGGEFRRVFDEQRFGFPIEESLEDLCDRVEILDVRIFVTAVLIQRQVGGNLAEILDNLSHTIRERFTIRRQVRVYTAQGRFTGYLLAVLPIALALLISALNPLYMRILFEVPVGRLMVSVAAILQITGYFIIRRIVDIEI